MSEPPPHAGQELPPAADVILSSVHLLVTIGFERTGLNGSAALTCVLTGPS